MRGTTPKVTFKIPLDKAMIAKAKISFKYGDDVLLAKNTGDCDIQDKKVSAKLTRAESLLFPDDAYISVQLVMETPAGDVLKTPTYSVYSSELLDPEELK